MKENPPSPIPLLAHGCGRGLRARAPSVRSHAGLRIMRMRSRVCGASTHPRGELNVVPLIFRYATYYRIYKKELAGICVPSLDR